MGVAVGFLFLATSALSLLAVPPWQHPDEPQHFEFVALLAEQRWPDLSRRADAAIERNILESMFEHRWWERLARPMPESPPPRFSDAPVLRETTIGGVPMAPPLYYIVASRLLRWAELTTLMPQYYALRILSQCFGAMTLAVIWLGARRLLGDRAAFWTSACLASLPQFVLVSSAVNPDALANLLSAVAWWQVVLVWTVGSVSRVARPAVLACLCAAALVLTKGTGLPVALAAGMLVLVGVILKMESWRERGIAAGAFLAVGLVGAAVVWWTLPQEVRRLSDYLRASLTARAAVVTGPSFLDYITGLFDSAWLAGGWLSVATPPWGQVAARVAGITTAVMLIVAGLSRYSAIRQALALCAPFIAVQLTAVTVSTFTHGVAAQGRYLLPVAGPAAVLAFLALSSSRDERGAGLHWAGFAFVAAFAFAGWMSALVPAFLS